MKKQITIQTENGFQVLDLEISFDNDNMDEASIMTIKTNYQGKEIIASGNHYPWTDAYANLQKQLPENAKLICCVACRYGNGCPVGDGPDELFCTKDVSVSCKSDLFFYTEDDNERQKRSKGYTELIFRFYILVIQAICIYKINLRIEIKGGCYAFSNS